MENRDTLMTKVLELLKDMQERELRILLRFLQALLRK